MAVWTHHGLAIVDATTFQTEEVVPNSAGLTAPIFQPGNKALLCKADNGLVRVDIKSGLRQVVIDAKNGFYSIFGPTFIGHDEVLFNGEGPKNAALVAAVKALGVSEVGDAVPYRLKFGSQPQLAYKDILREHLAVRNQLAGWFSASRNAERVVFSSNALTREEQDSRGGDWGGRDLFLIEQGAVFQVTHLGVYMGSVGISDDGSTAIFGVYPKPLTEIREHWSRRTFEPWAVDLGARRVVNLNLPARIAVDPNFN